MSGFNYSERFKNGECPFIIKVNLMSVTVTMLYNMTQSFLTFLKPLNKTNNNRIYLLRLL